MKRGTASAGPGGQRQRGQFPSGTAAREKPGALQRAPAPRHAQQPPSQGSTLQPETGRSRVYADVYSDFTQTFHATAIGIPVPTYEEAVF